MADLVAGLRARFLKGNLTKEDREVIADLLDEAELMAHGADDRLALGDVGSDPYRYFAVVRPSVYDGDTARVWMDQGFGDNDPNAPVRFWGIDAPEISRVSAAEKKRGRKVRDHVREMIGGRGVILKSHKMKANSQGAFEPGKGKYGRYLMEIIALDEDGRPFNVNEYLVNEGMAEINTYGAPFNGFTQPQ